MSSGAATKAGLQPASMLLLAMTLALLSVEATATKKAAVAATLAVAATTRTATASYKDSLAGVTVTEQEQRSFPRRLMQFTGATVAGQGRAPMQQAYYAPVGAAAPVTSYRESAFASNPAVGVMNNAMATGQAPSDILSARARGYVRGKIMGQRIDAAGVATANVGHNQYGGITAVGNAAGQFQTTGPYGYLGGQGQARAAAATTREVGPGGQTILSGAAAAQASGMVYGGLPTGQGFAARGSASAQAEGQVAYWSKK